MRSNNRGRAGSRDGRNGTTRRENGTDRPGPPSLPRSLSLSRRRSSSAVAETIPVWIGTAPSETTCDNGGGQTSIVVIWDNFRICWSPSRLVDHKKQMMSRRRRQRAATDIFTLPSGRTNVDYRRNRSPWMTDDERNVVSFPLLSSSFPIEIPIPSVAGGYKRAPALLVTLDIVNLCFAPNHGIHRIARPTNQLSV